MEAKLDLSKTYAVALEGGGAKGAYQVGVWQALEEAGVRFSAVSGTSVGALNGAFMAMGRLEEAKAIWENITFSQVMAGDDALLRSLFDGSFSFEDLGEMASYVLDTVREGGLDITPLRKLIQSSVDEDVLRASPVELYIMTYSLTDRRELDIDVKTLPPGKIWEMLLASAYFPAFKNEPFSGGRRFTDGGVQDRVPIHSLISRGYRDILVLRIFGFGVERRVKVPRDVRLTTIAPREDLGSVLRFDASHTRRIMRLGYFDGQRAIYGLAGEKYYVNRTMTEAEAYQALLTLRAPGESLRAFHEKSLRQLARRRRQRDGDYYALFLAQLEHSAGAREVEVFRIYEDRELLELAGLGAD